MANKIIKYTLNANGTIPDYIDDGGYFPKPNSNASPQDHDIIGATQDGSSETGLGELANEAAIKTYLDSYTGDWTETDPADMENLIDFNQTAAAQMLWAKKVD
tara:strand:+ start:1305 stop:1613 length:309 start_codon:yes stop_codon:yes gene_type:complete